jgi:ABC-2 type transport system permease protein
MKMIKAGVHNEVAKMLNLKKYRALLVLICVLSILISILGGAAKGFIGLLSTNLPITVLSILTKFLLPLIIAMIVADLFTAEQENGTIKAVIIRPISRIRIFTSKVLSIVLFVIIALLLSLVTSLISTIFINGISTVNIIEIFLAYIVSIVPMIPIILFAVTISQLCKSSSSTVMLSVFGYICIIVACTVLPSISPMVFTSYTGWYKLFIGAAMPISNILNILVLLIAYSMILFSVSSWVFEKKEY